MSWFTKKEKLPKHPCLEQWDGVVDTWNHDWEEKDRLEETLPGGASYTTIVVKCKKCGMDDKHRFDGISVMVKYEV